MTNQEIESCLKVLERLNTETCALDGIEEDLRIALMREAGRLTRPSKLEMIKKPEHVLPLNLVKLSLVIGPLSNPEKLHKFKFLTNCLFL
jgi:hypothetical protein